MSNLQALLWAHLTWAALCQGYTSQTIICCQSYRRQIWSKFTKFGLNLTSIWQNFILVYVWIWPQFGQILPKFSKFWSNLRNEGLTTNCRRFASVSLALVFVQVFPMPAKLSQMRIHQRKVQLNHHVYRQLAMKFPHDTNRLRYFSSDIFYMVIKSKLSSSATPRNLTVETFVRIESGSLMSDAFFWLEIIMYDVLL